MFRKILLPLFFVISTFLHASGQSFVPELYPCYHSYHSVSTVQEEVGADASNYMIALKIDVGGKSIEGSTTISMKVTVDATVTTFDLTSALQVDSVVFETGTLTYNRTGSQLAVTWPRLIKADEEIQVTIHYSGTPEQDQSWGGFYFTGVYGFNLGVGFTADPHNFGRAWFPCFDNFSDRATYEFKIITNKGELAQCNGSLVARNDLPNNLVEHHWMMRDPIPTYLASVAVAPYTEISWNYNGIPILLSAVQADSANMAKSFENLPGCIAAFESSYGPHPFERIGFNLVPFNGGAMEHATNIAYPRFGAMGNKAYETLWAHELAHHWWGNTVTCIDQSDMWINEGWASYSEKIFLEGVYGRHRYNEDVAANHLHVIRFAHWLDGDTLAISGVDHARTYGTHVYKKGADVAHTLRGYMGDSAFFKATASFISAYKFQNASSELLRDHFQQFTTADLTSFFNQWVFNPGFPNFDILSVTSLESVNGFSNTLRIRQRSRFAPSMYTNVPMSITAYDTNGDSINIKAVLSGKESFISFESDFEPVLVVLDREERISDAVTVDQMWVTETGTHILKNGLMNLTIAEINDSSLVRIEHNWVRPDDYFTHDALPVLSRERYWKVDGIWNEGMLLKARLYYDGKPGDGNRGGLDVNLIRQTEDSLVLMYREGPDKYWREYEHYTKTVGSPLDKFGYVDIDQLKKGEYTFAMYHAELLSVNEVTAEEKSNDRTPEISPNPANDTVTFTIESARGGVLEITDSKGVVLQRIEIDDNNFQFEYNVSNLPQGIYFVGVSVDNQPYNARRFIVRH